MDADETGIELKSRNIIDSKGYISSLSEVIIYDNFKPKNNKYIIYLYNYIGNFSEVNSECHIYHHK